MFEKLKAALSNIVSSLKSEKKSELESAAEEKIEPGKEAKEVKEVKEEAKKEALEKPESIEIMHHKEPTPKEVRHEQKSPALEKQKEPAIEKKEKQAKPTEEPAEKLQAELTLKTKLKALITRRVKITDEDFKRITRDLKVRLIEANVAVEAANEIIQELKNVLVDKEFSPQNFDGEVYLSIKAAIMNYLKDSSVNFDIVDFCKKAEKPVKVLFLGPNGSGKTTTIAKIAYLLKQNGISCVFSASDTFRAAAIEQLEKHGSNLNVKVIKHNYGSDPASVAFDAIAYAKANAIDAVLIDTAGRQETNKNLMEEMKKINRVVKPDLKIFVVESIAGNTLVEQIQEFKSQIGVDGIILTKLDCDEKGGAILSVSKLTKVPIFYIGTGQNYSDIEKYDPERFVEKVF